MLQLYNTLGRRLETFRPVSDARVTIFTCGPSVYQRSHIGNFRTFLFEDILVRYLDFLGYRTERGMNFTDVEDKALKEAAVKGIPVGELADANIEKFLKEINQLSMKLPDHLPKASEYIDQAAKLIAALLDKGVAYRHGANVYFDPLKFPGFGRLFGLDMSRWPSKKRRFHKDTYPGVQWNLGDFVLWHGCKEGDPVCWDSPVGSGRPSWNIQDPGMISSIFDETLSIYCGGMDNLYRHHDYSLAVLETVRPYPMARYWLHGKHLLVDGKKMSKSRGNVVYTDDLLAQGYDFHEIRFFLVYGHYRDSLNYSEGVFRDAAGVLKEFRKGCVTLAEKAEGYRGQADSQAAEDLLAVFRCHMDDDLNVKAAVDNIADMVRRRSAEDVRPATARALCEALDRIEGVLKIGLMPDPLRG